jgi:hypothetical protein
MSSTPVRPSCVLCALKHLAQARSLLLEAHKGYPESYWFSLGHLGEAEDELVKEYEGLANQVRDVRKRLEGHPQELPDFASLVLLVSEVAGYDVAPFLRKPRNLALVASMLRKLLGKLKAGAT